MADVNKVWLSGVAASKPVLGRLPGKGLFICTFSLSVREDYQSRGAPQSCYQTIQVEALGQQSDRVFALVQEGQRYKVDGYLKVNDSQTLVVRAFAVNPDESDESRAYDEGLRSALSLLLKSVDVKSAAESIRLLLSSRK
jgi:primosomal replication protein N